MAPEDFSKPQGRTRRFLKRLRGMTGLPVVRPVVEAPGTGRRRVVRTSVRRNQWRSLDEAPEDVRRLWEDTAAESRTEREPGESGVRRSVRITVRDADGTERTYASLNALPPEIRDKLDLLSPDSEVEP